MRQAARAGLAERAEGGAFASRRTPGARGQVAGRIRGGGPWACEYALKDGATFELKFWGMEDFFMFFETDPRHVATTCPPLPT